MVTPVVIVVTGVKITNAACVCGFVRILTGGRGACTLSDSACSVELGFLVQILGDPLARRVPVAGTAWQIHRPTEQILHGNQVHLYQGFSNIKLANSAGLFVLYQGGVRPRPQVYPRYKTN